MSMLFPVAESRSESTPCARVSIATRAWVEERRLGMLMIEAESSCWGSGEGS